MTSHRLSITLAIALALLSLPYLLHAAGVLSRNVGLSHDELWDFTPAVGMIRAESVSRPQEIRIFHHPIPLVSGPYQGALKTWTVAPLLLAFGTSPKVILGLNVFFAIIFLLALYWALIPVVGEKWACMVFALPLVDTNFLLTAPMDTGPSLFQYIFISLAMGALFRYMKDRRSKHHTLTWFFVGCILAQKLTSLPVVICFAVVIAALSVARFFEDARLGKLRQAVSFFFVIPGIAFIVPLVPHLIYFRKSGFARLFSMTASDRLPYFTTLGANFSFLRTMFDGADWYRRITLMPDPDPTRISGLALFGIVVMACSLFLCFFSGFDRKTGRCILVCVLLGIGTFALFPAFRGLDRPWHLYVFTPIFDAGCVVATAYCLAWAGVLYRRHAAILQVLIVAGLLAGVFLSMRYAAGMLQQIEHYKGAAITSPAIYDLYGAIEKSNLRVIHAINYSLADPIYVLSRGTVRTDELAWTDLTRTRIEDLLAETKAHPNTGIVCRFCEYRKWDPAWIQWLNREPQIFDFFNGLENAGKALNVVRCRDSRQTEFLLITANQ